MHIFGQVNKNNMNRILHKCAATTISIVVFSTILLAILYVIGAFETKSVFSILTPRFLLGFGLVVIIRSIWKNHNTEIHSQV